MTRPRGCPLIQQTETYGVRRVVLDAGRGNALGAELLAGLAAAFEPGLQPPGPVVLAARGRSFCTGLDLVTGFELDRDRMRSLMLGFHRALQAVVLWPHPVVAEIQGHALAGGALLALCADRRLMSHGSARFGIHGVQLGVVYPQIAIEILRWRLGRVLAEQVLFSGALRAGHQALSEGLIDELVDPEELPARAIGSALGLVGPAGAGPDLKALVQRPLANRLAEIDVAARESWLDHWFSPGTRSRVEEARTALLDRTHARPGEVLD